MAVEPQRIVEVAQYAAAFDDVIALCFGQADVASPKTARDGVVAALDRGETFYPDVRGVAPLRDALASYSSRLYSATIGEERIAVTASGMAALNLALNTIVEPGDNVVLVAPFWPNTRTLISLLGGEPRLSFLQPDRSGRWMLDLDSLFAQVDDATRAIVVNSPSNPTGWMAREDELMAILSFARRRGLWIVADEVYARITYDMPAAPSVLALCEPDDRVLVVNSFSKAWAMTGWRIGWLTCPPNLRDVLAEVIECMTSGATSFAQYGALAALEEGEAFIEQFRRYCAHGRTMVSEALGGLPGVKFAPPDAAFYAFFSVEGVSDSLGLAKQLIREQRVALAPGVAFGQDFKSWFRLCFAQDPGRLERGLDRLRTGLVTH